MNAVIMSFDPNEKQSVICERNRSLSRDSLGLAMRIPLCSCLCKVCSRVSDILSQALCNLPLAFLADFTLCDTFHTPIQSS